MPPSDSHQLFRVAVCDGMALEVGQLGLLEERRNVVAHHLVRALR
jgi:hypothetical protein